MNWLNRIREYYKDKELADKCGLEVKDICVHEYDGNIYMDIKYAVSNEVDQLYNAIRNKTCKYKCKKCGEFYR